MLLLLLVGARSQALPIIPPRGKPLAFHKSFSSPGGPLPFQPLLPHLDMCLMDQLLLESSNYKAQPMHAQEPTPSVDDHKAARHVSKPHMGIATLLTARLRPPALAGSAPEPARPFDSASWGSPFSAPQVSNHLCGQDDAVRLCWGCGTVVPHIDSTEQMSQGEPSITLPGLGECFASCCSSPHIHWHAMIPHAQRSYSWHKSAGQPRWSGQLQADQAKSGEYRDSDCCLSRSATTSNVGYVSMLQVHAMAVADTCDLPANLIRGPILSGSVLLRSAVFQLADLSGFLPVLLECRCPLQEAA